MCKHTFEPRHYGDDGRPLRDTFSVTKWGDGLLEKIKCTQCNLEAYRCYSSKHPELLTLDFKFIE